MLMAGPMLAFLTQWAWVRALESASLTIPGDEEAAGFGDTTGPPLLRAATPSSTVSTTGLLKSLNYWTA